MRMAVTDVSLGNSEHKFCSAVVVKFDSGHFRDRERGVPGYNQFHRLPHKDPFADSVDGAEASLSGSGAGRTSPKRRWPRLRRCLMGGGSWNGNGDIVYHVDEAIDGNGDENHPFIKLLEADGFNDLYDGTSRGDPGDPYPGRSKNATLTNTSNPDAKSLAELRVQTVLCVAGAFHSVVGPRERALEHARLTTRDERRESRVSS